MIRIVAGHVFVLLVKLGTLALTLGAVLAMFPAVLRCPAESRQGGAQHMIDNLSQATEMYQTEHGAYPPDAGYSGSLGKRHYEFRSGELDSRGNILSPIRPTDVIRYRNNRILWPDNLRDPGAHNKRRFDLACPDAKGREDGVNNW